MKCIITGATTIHTRFLDYIYLYTMYLTPSPYLSLTLSPGHSTFSILHSCMQVTTESVGLLGDEATLTLQFRAC